MRYSIAIGILFCASLASTAINADSKENAMFPIRGWSEIQWGMTRGQIEKITGNPVKRFDREDESAGVVRFYGYPAQLLVSFDKAGGLVEFGFDVLASTHADAAKILHQIHGYLVADIGKPTIDGIDKVYSNEDRAFNTMWCSKTGTVFMAVAGGYKQSKPWAAYVQYRHDDVCHEKAKLLIIRK